MKKIILILLINLLYADNYEFDNISINNKNKITYYNQSITLSDNSSNSNSLKDTITRKELKTYNNINIDDNIKISSTIGYYANSKYVNKDKDLGEVWLSEDRSNIFIEKLYAQFKLYEYNDWKLSFAYGIIPLTGGNIKKFSTQDEIQGNGLFTLIDLNLQGGFIILSNENNIFKVGKNYWKKDNWQHDEKLIEANNNTDGTFIFYEYHNDKHTIELDYIDANVQYKGYKMADAQMYGLGYSYDDSIENNTIYYGILGYSVWDSSMMDVLNSGVFGSTTNSIKWANKNMSQYYDFNNGKKDGASLLLGLKYYTEIMTKETDIGFEYFCTSKEYSSFNNGSLFYNDYGFWRRRGTDIYTIYADLKITKNLIASIKTSFVKNGYTAKNGSIAGVTDTPLTNNFYKTEKNILLKISYEF